MNTNTHFCHTCMSINTSLHHFLTVQFVVHRNFRIGFEVIWPESTFQLDFVQKGTSKRLHFKEEKYYTKFRVRNLGLLSYFRVNFYYKNMRQWICTWNVFRNCEFKHCVKQTKDLLFYLVSTEILINVNVQKNFLIKKYKYVKIVLLNLSGQDLTLFW